jgi:hypothetical protein
MSLSACAPSLRVGDKAFAEGRYAEAAEAYDLASEEDAAAVLFRRAMLSATAASPAYDPGQAIQLLEQVRALHPASIYGVAAGHGLEVMRKRSETEARLQASDEEVARLTQAIEGRIAEEAERAELHRAVLAKLERLEHLDHEGHRLNLELQQLKEENARLKEELEALKSIDLRR